MVEHDLAKVGVASSNLVSRSIIIFLFFLSANFLSAKPNLIIKNHYCIKNSVLNIKDIYPSYKKNIDLMRVSNTLSTFKVPSLEIISKIKNYISLQIIDKSGGIVVLDKQCNIKYHKKEIFQALKKIFQTKYKNIKIIKLNIKPINSFPQDFSNFYFEKIIVKPNNIRKKSGNFIVVYKNNSEKIIRIFFRYKIDAKIYLFKAKHNISNGKILSQNDYEKVMSSFDKIPLNFVDNLKNNFYITKNFIKKGSVITKYMIKINPLIHKKDIVRTIIKDGNLQIEFFSKALQEGNKGDIIKTVGKNGKIYKVKIIDKGLVIVL